MVGRSALVFLAAVLVCAGSARAGFPSFGTGCSRADFTSEGQTIRAELCRASSRAAAVVVLHGCGGFSTFDHRIVVTLPRFGISTLDVDYFGPTPPPGTHGFCHGFGKGGDEFATWIAETRDAGLSLQRLGYHHVGVVGWSLGGGIAVASAAAAGSGRTFEAVAGFSTGAFDAASFARKLPPTILLSGGRTDAIPLAETLPLYQALRQAHVPTALYVYPNGSHNWPGRQGTLGINHAGAFLCHYLHCD